MDHGVLNIPLSKRGNIDAQIDRYKAEQVAASRAGAKNRAAETQKLRQEARALFARVTADRVLELATRCSVTAAEMRKKLRSDCHWQPRLVIALLKGAA